MKRLLLLLLSLALLSACGKRGVIADEIEKIQSTLPLSLGPMGSVSQIADEDSVVAMTVVLNDSVIDVAQLQIDRTNLLEAFRRQFYSSDAKRLLRAMSEERKDFLLRYVDARRTAKREVRLAADELKAVAQQRMDAKGVGSVAPSPMESPRAILVQSIVESDRKALPNKVSDGLTIVSVDSTASGILYTTRVDTSLVSPAVLKLRRDAMRRDLLAVIRRTTDPQARQTYRLCGEYGVALTFSYVHPRMGEIVRVTLSPQELKAAAR